MRLFVALHPPPEALDDLAGLLARLHVGAAASARLGVRLVDPATAHVTLAFLGETEPDRLAGVTAALDRAARRCRAATAPPRLRFGGGGVFDTGRRTVLWAGLRGDREALDLLAGLLREELARDGVRYDEKPFRPHLTIARPGDRVAPAQVAADRRTLDGYLGPPWVATELALVRSQLGQPARHQRLSTWPL